MHVFLTSESIRFYPLISLHSTSRPATPVFPSSNTGTFNLGLAPPSVPFTARPGSPAGSTHLLTVKFLPSMSSHIMGSRLCESGSKDTDGGRVEMVPRGSSAPAFRARAARIPGGRDENYGGFDLSPALPPSPFAFFPPSPSLLSFPAIAVPSFLSSFLFFLHAPSTCAPPFVLPSAHPAIRFKLPFTHRRPTFFVPARPLPSVSSLTLLSSFSSRVQPCYACSTLLGSSLAFHKKALTRWHPVKFGLAPVHIGASVLRDSIGCL
ncbi:hypothetical protein MVEN_02594500 [Mycena venus]|uniref:Uncharacterized protein n=1 Tax=Mycena venus TaxID=2733690 RepID=A0A8H6U3B0_9AGAR|nr:hypothetical protein MVEN_02594500 [Mycena venus]